MFRIVLFTLGVLSICTTAAAQNPTRADVERYMARVNEFKPGLGDDEGLPAGRPLQFPTGVSLAGPISGADENTDCGPEAGSGVYVMVCVPLCNATAAAIEVDLPAGLLVVSKSVGPFQNGMLVERVTVRVPPTPCGGGGIPLEAHPDDVPQELPATPPAGFPVQLNLYCVNESNDPSAPGVPYALGPVTSDPDLLDLLERLEGRVLDEEGMDVVQTAIYSITEGKGLSWNDERALERL